MSLLQEIIIFLWLLPVATQIFLPLIMLLVWSVGKIFTVPFNKSAL